MCLSLHNQYAKIYHTMTQTEVLIVLVNSMTKSEKKSFMIYASQSESNKAYLFLFGLINKLQIGTPEELKNAFQKNRLHCSFDTAVKYLYKVLLKILVSLRQAQDSYYSLFNRLLVIRVLCEKLLFDEALKLTRKTINEAKLVENQFVLLIAQRTELEILLSQNFNHVSEKILINKHFQIGQTLTGIRRINEQTTLYELLKYRMIYNGSVRSAKQKKDLNDLVFSEMSIVASTHTETFEIRKMHQLFQANYLIAIGDYKSALHSFYELNKVFENNKHLWANPPIYYVLVLEGILESLHIIKDYNGMQYFVDKLKRLKSTSANFRANVMCLAFQYELFPLLDLGDFAKANKLMAQYSLLYENQSLLNITRQAELLLYTTIIYLENNNIVLAKKTINRIFFNDKIFYHLSLYRTIRMIKLMVYYELKDFDFINLEIRSIKREINSELESYKTERLMMSVLGKQMSFFTLKKRLVIWEKISHEIDVIKQDKFEMQVLQLFDFTAWIESKIRDISLIMVLKEKYSAFSHPDVNKQRK